MKALRFSESEGLRVEDNVPKPIIKDNEALIKISRAGICSTDLEIIRGYVPGFDHTIGHEFVGIVEECTSDPTLLGKRVVGEINCICTACQHPDPIFRRNHTPDRVVLGIIGKDGTMAEYCTIPVENLHIVPESIDDQVATFAEPLAAACRIIEQSVIKQQEDDSKVAVIGDGKLGILIAHALSMHGCNVTFLGRHPRKLDMVEGVAQRVVVGETTATELAAAYDVVIEASGSPNGIKLALALCRPLGTLVLKSTCSSVGEQTKWCDVANDVVVNEKVVVGSRCGPFQPALELLKDEKTKKLVSGMVDATFLLSEGVHAIERAQQKGTLKVQLIID